MAKRPIKTKTKTDREVEEAAKEAIAEMETETFDSPESRDIAFALSENNALTDREIDEKDIFAEGKKKFIARNTSGQFRIYRDGAWVGTKPSSYTWEKLRNDYGKQGGHFKVVAIDGSNVFAGSQSLEVAAIEETETVRPIQEQNSQGPLQMMEVMKENQREAEAKAQSQQTGIASVMASMVQMQTQSTQMMMQMFQKSSEQTQNMLIAMMGKASEPKGPDPLVAMLMPLITALVTQKPKDDGFNAMSVFKMVEDGKKDARNEAKETARIIEEKAKKYAAEMAPDGDGEESLTKTVIKSFGPVLADIMAKNQQAQMAQQIEEQRRLQLMPPRPSTQSLESRQAIPAAQPNERHRARPRPLNTDAPNTQPVAAPSTPPAPPVGASHPGESSLTPSLANGSEITVQDATIVESKMENGPAQVIAPQEVLVDSRLQEQLFNFCASDIGEALLQQRSALETARLCLSKLENAGVPRQTVLAAFKLEDFYRYAERFALPDAAKPWLKEFHESIAKDESKVAVRPAPNTEAAPRQVASVNGINGNRSRQPQPARTEAVAVRRSQPPRPGARTQPQGRPQDPRVRDI